MCDVHDNTGNSEEHQDKMFKCQEDLEKLVSQVTLTSQNCTLEIIQLRKWSFIIKNLRLKQKLVLGI